MKSLANLFSNFKSMMYRKYGENPGTMLVHTGVLGWILSSLAQVGAVIVNDKIPQEQKTFLIPQEIADAGINIASFYLFTNYFKKGASKLVSTGKLTTKNIKEFLVKHGAKDKIGQIDFNIEKLPNYKKIKEDYKSFKNGVDVVASIAGSIISSNIVTPVLRNQCAAKFQKAALARKQETDTNSVKSPERISMNTYINLSQSKYSSGSLKI